MFSNACEYGLKAMIYLAAHSTKNELLKVSEIADNIDSPIAFTSKVLQQLVKANLVDSNKGPNGGYKIEVQKLGEISLLQIVTAIDGDTLLTGCGLGLKTCNEDKPCPIHNHYSVIRNNLKDMLKNTLLKDFSANKFQHNLILKR